MGVAENLTRGRQLVADRLALVFAVVVAVAFLADLTLKLATGTQSVSGLASYLWDGLQIGLIFGLAGIGLSMTYSILGFANFSHGDLVTSGAFFGWMTAWFVAGLGQFPAADLFLLGAGGPIAVNDLGITVMQAPLAVLGGLVVASAGTIALALLLDRLVYRPMRDQGGIPLLIASIGAALAVRYVLVFIWGTSRRGLTAGNKATYAVPVVDGVVRIDSHELTLVILSIGLMLGVHYLLQRTKLGTAMRAMADNKALAQVTGIPIERVIRDTWIIGGGLAGGAGFLIALNQGSMSFNLGWLLLLFIFAAVILGGIGSIYGAMAGGIIIGMASRVSLVWLPEAGFARAAAFAVMIIVLLFRPQGLFGGVTTA